MFDAIKTFFTRETQDTLRFYLKSGNSFVIDGVTHWSIENVGDAITAVRIAQAKDAKAKLLVRSIDLSQIEAVVVVTE